MEADVGRFCTVEYSTIAYNFSNALLSPLYSLSVSRAVSVSKTFSTTHQSIYKVPKLEAWNIGRTYANIIDARENNIWTGIVSKPFCILQLLFYSAWRFPVE
jgi:hypothetical protein